MKSMFITRASACLLAVFVSVPSFADVTTNHFPTIAEVDAEFADTEVSTNVALSVGGANVRLRFSVELAIARAVFGDVNPSGRLPVSFRSSPTTWPGARTATRRSRPHTRSAAAMRL